LSSWASWASSRCSHRPRYGVANCSESVAQELEPLWNGAEAYIQTWETAQTWSGIYTGEVDKGIRAQCRADRAELLVGPSSLTEEELKKT
jgi:hypothetical protein